MRRGRSCAYRENTAGGVARRTEETFVSRTTPTISLSHTVFPIGFVFGKYRRTSASFTITTIGARGSSCGVKLLPATTGTPIVSKKFQRVDNIDAEISEPLRLPAL